MQEGPTENPLSTKERLEKILVHGRDGRFVELEYIEGLLECPTKGRIMLVKYPDKYQITVDDLENINTTDYGGSYGLTITLDSNGNILEAYNNRPRTPLDNPEEALEERLGLLEKGKSTTKPSYIDYCD